MFRSEWTSKWKLVQKVWKNLQKKTKFKNFMNLDENITLVEMAKTKVVYDKTIYCGQCILDNSKVHMSKFHYGYMQPKFGERAKLLFTDTDSLCYEIESEDFYKEIEADVPKWFDTSEYPKDHPSGLPRVNKKKLGEGKSITIFGTSLQFKLCIVPLEIKTL